MGIDCLTRLRAVSLFIALHQPGIERVRVHPRNVELDAEPMTIEKDEVKFLEPEEGHRYATLIVTKLSLIRGQKWGFLEDGATLVVQITDDEFWKNLHQGRYSFSAGDRLRVYLHSKVVQNRGRPMAENTIIKVLEVLPRPEQMRLNSTKDDAGV